MALSNIAVPKYYGLFREAVVNGEIPVCQEVSMEMNRIDQLIADPTYYYDPVPVEAWISFCEKELTLADGGDLKLLDTFKLWGEQVFGWYYFERKSVFEPYENQPGGRFVIKKIKKRLITKQYLILPRGAAKTMYGEMIQAYYLVCDSKTNQQITVAPTMAQAEELMTPFRTAITRSRGPLFKFLTTGSIQNTTGSRALRPKLVSTKKGIENFVTGTSLEVRPMSIDKLQGLKSRINTVDEWLSGVTREDVIGTLEQGASKNSDYLIVAFSSEGTVRNGPGDSIKLELRKILRGEYKNPHVSIWYYKLDDIKEVGNPEAWVKAQPNIGKTVSYDTYQLDVERAEKNPEARNDILAKRFNLEMEGYTYFFTYDETKCHAPNYFNGMPCAMGADLSRGDDFCAFTFMFPMKDMLGVKTRCYITENTYHKLPPALRNKYDTFIQEGSLVVMNGVVLDMNAVYDELDQFIQETGYDVRCFGYDPYNAQVFVDRWAAENGPFGIEKVIQGSKTESVPLGEIKALMENRQITFDQDLMSWTFGNCITITDTNGNRKLYKDRLDRKIDSVAALMDAYVAFKVNQDSFM